MLEDVTDLGTITELIVVKKIVLDGIIVAFLKVIVIRQRTVETQQVKVMRLRADEPGMVKAFGMLRVERGLIIVDSPLDQVRS